MQEGISILSGHFYTVIIYRNGVTMQIESKCGYVHIIVFSPEKCIKRSYFHTGGGLSLVLGSQSSACDMDSLKLNESAV